MTCKKCQNVMFTIGVTDEGPGGVHAHNVYECDTCLTVAVENVWSHPGILWVMSDLSTTLDPPRPI